MSLPRITKTGDRCARRGFSTQIALIDQGTADISHKFSDVDTLHGYWVYQRDLRREATAGHNDHRFW